jgi:hypothetical protein
MKRVVVFLCAILSFGLAAWASGKSYPVTLHDAVIAGGTELSPGDYKLEVASDKAVLRKGKVSTEAPVKVETGNEKYEVTQVVLTRADGKAHIREIHLAGTNTTLVFAETQP